MKSKTVTLTFDNVYLGEDFFFDAEASAIVTNAGDDPNDWDIYDIIIDWAQLYSEDYDHCDIVTEEHYPLIYTKLYTHMEDIIYDPDTWLKRYEEW